MRICCANRMDCMLVQMIQMLGYAMAQNDSICRCNATLRHLLETHLQSHEDALPHAFWERKSGYSSFVWNQPPKIADSPSGGPCNITVPSAKYPSIHQTDRWNVEFHLFPFLPCFSPFIFPSKRKVTRKKSNEVSSEKQRTYKQPQCPRLDLPLPRGRPMSTGNGINCPWVEVYAVISTWRTRQLPSLSISLPFGLSKTKR